ncbi:MAG: hypothetical protein AAGJ46_13855 [Planctomycetota bacterium]
MGNSLILRLATAERWTALLLAAVLAGTLASAAPAEDLYDLVAGKPSEAKVDQAKADQANPVTASEPQHVGAAAADGDLFDLLNEDESDPDSQPVQVAAAEELPPVDGESGSNGEEPARSNLPERKPPPLESILAASVAIAPKAQEIDGETTSIVLPYNLAADQFGDYRLAMLGGNEQVRFAMPPYTWASPAMRHGPLYFEQPNLERYGTHRGGQWEASAEAVASFFAKTVFLPYQLVDRPPRCTEYTLGVYRPGGCTPHYFHLHGPSTRGSVAETLAVMGLIFLFP